jgi:hypothetical protein
LNPSEEEAASIEIKKILEKKEYIAQVSSFIKLIDFTNHQ